MEPVRMVSTWVAIFVALYLLLVVMAHIWPGSYQTDDWDAHNCGMGSSKYDC